MRKMNKHWSAVWIVMAALVFTRLATAVTIQIGDSDSFGFADLSSLNNANGNPVDATAPFGRLNAGDALPDLDGDGQVIWSSWVQPGDNFDNRSATEAADPNAKWTDIALSESFTNQSLFDAGNAGNDGADPFGQASFQLTFSAPASGPDHFLNFLLGDLGDPGGEVKVDDLAPVEFTPFQGEGLVDGGITATSVDVPFSKMADGVLNIEINSTDPYVAIDAILLDAQQTEPGAIPEPATVCLLGLGLLGLVGAGRKKVLTKN